MRILTLEPKPIAETNLPECRDEVLPILRGHPACRISMGRSTSRRRGCDRRHQRPPRARKFKHQTGPQLRLLGEWLPQILAESILPGLPLPAGRVGVLLAGDFYTVPSLDKRGGSGDVDSVWQAFGEHFHWVVGVAGNHDTYAGYASHRISEGLYTSSISNRS